MFFKLSSARSRLLVQSIFALLLALSSQASIGKSKIVKLVSDPYPPYVMDGPEGQGYVTEMAIKILHKAGYQAEYIAVPFRRAILGLDDGTYDGLLAVSPGRTGFVYPENGFGTSQTFFFVLKSNPWQFHGIESLDSVALGVIDGYEFSGSQSVLHKIDAYILENKDNVRRVQFNHGTTALAQNMEKLKLGRIDAIVEDDAVFWYTAKKAGLTDQFKVAGNLTPIQKMTVGFSLKNPRARELAKVISDGVKKLKDSGEYDKILAKYGASAATRTMFPPTQ